MSITCQYPLARLSRARELRRHSVTGRKDREKSRDVRRFREHSQLFPRDETPLWRARGLGIELCMKTYQLCVALDGLLIPTKATTKSAVLNGKLSRARLTCENLHIV